MITIKNTDLIELRNQIFLPDHSNIRVEINVDETITKELMSNLNVAILCVDKNNYFRINSECLDHESDEVLEYTSKDSI